MGEAARCGGGGRERMAVVMVAVGQVVGAAGGVWLMRQTAGGQRSDGGRCGRGRRVGHIGDDGVRFGGAVGNGEALVVEDRAF